MRYRLSKVEELPSTVDERIVYVSDEYELAVLKCACGCGHTVTLLLGDGHRVRDVDGFADISPSIGVWDAPCRSHFLIRQGRVVWSEDFSDSEIRSAMLRQLKRHIKSAVPRRRWYTRFTAWAARIIRRWF